VVVVGTVGDGVEEIVGVVPVELGGVPAVVLAAAVVAPDVVAPDVVAPEVVAAESGPSAAAGTPLLTVPA
jgi:hypothetical protein